MVGDLPAGTVTMLFSDIEGSTALLSRLGDRYGQALSEHRAVLRAAFGAWRGREMDTEGDSFFVVFETAADAVACCLAAQRALTAHDWPDGDAIRVRMGLHSGEPARHEDGYIGMDVHRAARIAATAHGGQVVLSEVTLQLAGPLPEGASVRDLGFHRLKDIAAPERIYQLAGSGLREDFPALKSLGTHTSLPVPATPLVGRDDDVARLLAIVSQPDVRLVTLTGPGGVGKTRLSLAAAAALDHAFPHGVFFVALAAVRDTDLMWKTLAGDLDVDGDGPAAVQDYLRNRRMLLVLDNLEQLDGAGEIVAALAAAAPGLVVLATSRGPLHVQGEHEFAVPPLDVARAADVDAVAASSAVRLFAQQAAMVRPGFAITEDNAADVAAICRRLDGLPLAIELAASRVRLLAPRALLTRLGQSLGLAAAEAGRPSRQQTLRNVVAWSYDLLTPGTARVFRRMSVFAGGCDLDALAAVAGMGDGGPDPLEALAELHDVGLITVTEDADGEPRLDMLETIREYALERLQADDDLDGARRRRAEYYAGVVERARSRIDAPGRMWNIHVYTASSAGAGCAMLGGGGIGEHEASAVTGGGGIEEQATAVFGGGGTDEQDASAVAGGGGIEEHDASAVSGGGGIEEHEASAVTGAGGIGEHEASAVTGGGGIEEQPCAVLGGGGITDPERAGRRALADAASLAPDSISL